MDGSALHARCMRHAFQKAFQQARLATAVQALTCVFPCVPRPAPRPACVVLQRAPHSQLLSSPVAFLCNRASSALLFSDQFVVSAFKSFVFTQCICLFRIGGNFEWFHWFDLVFLSPVFESSVCDLQYYHKALLISEACDFISFAWPIP